MGDDGKGEELYNLCGNGSEPSLDKVKELVAGGANLDWKHVGGWVGGQRFLMLAIMGTLV